VSDVVVTRWIAASPPTVFAFFTDAERWTAWQGVGGKIAARAGGELRVIMPDAAAALTTGDAALLRSQRQNDAEEHRHRDTSNPVDHIEPPD